VNGKGAYLAPLIESLKAGNERYWGPFMSSDIFVYDILWPNMQAILSGQTTVDEGLAKIDTLLNEQNAKDRAKYPELGDTTIYYDSGFGGIFD
ncbi:MAG: hypothetical protein M1365_15360, partial [Actinobacteria bacterium]|nr:hypothetical protein [Actinomycetota bacterium]